ncbi:hypothetical protein [Acuticoccus sp. I52.16.1]|uniref:hypothetical protein n=1 Tax=Acuticoccus sp. I52.16.1 TaxID=2928472 RepID=UPI001FD41563|nr:hypothetical protein [Acuticoccus sp. I52.16.1]UOM34679.1 hypothetical protein MRB58_00225 [Acuticoccus sp. I52.16.1]
MGWKRAIGRCLLGALLASAIGSLMTAVTLAVVAAVGAPPSEGGSLVGGVVKGVVLFGVFGLIIAGVPGLLLGAPIWFAMDRAGLTPWRGGVVGAVVGLVLGIPIAHAFAPVCALSGALAGRWSVQLVDRWVPARTRARATPVPRSGADA